MTAYGLAEPALLLEAENFALGAANPPDETSLCSGHCHSHLPERRIAQDQSRFTASLKEVCVSPSEVRKLTKTPLIHVELSCLHQYDSLSAL